MWCIEFCHSLASRVVLAVLVCGVVLIPARGASAEGELDRLEAVWRQGDYARATRELIAYRERTGVRTPEVDYMIATSACRLPDRRQLGNEFFAWILQNYNLSPPTRTQVETQQKLCSASAAPERLRATAPAAMVGVAYHGKGGTNFDAQPSGDSRGTVVAAIPPEQFAQRLFVPSDAKTAARNVAQLVGPEFDIQVVGHFILVGPRPVARSAGVAPGILNAAAPPRGGGNPDASVLGGTGSLNPSGTPDLDPDDFFKNKSSKLPPPQSPNAPARAQAPNLPADSPATQSARPDPRDMVQQMAPATSPSAEELKRVGESLEQYLQFFVSKYGMRPPPFLITVYFAADRRQLRELARKLHGIDVAPGSIGYSFLADQSMVGWADGKAYGTFAHELFHVMVRGNFGDIPPFLDEGMAALYEVSRFDQGRAVGVGNWRGVLLRKFWAERPGIKDLVQMNRGALDDVAGASEVGGASGKQAANHATARYLMLYFQERGELLPVYKAFRSRKVNDRPAAQGVELLEAVLGRSLGAVDTEFAEWFGKLPP
jgi:hypothetical protein